MWCIIPPHFSQRLIRLSTHPVVLFGIPRSLGVLSVSLQLTSTGLSLKCSLEQTESVLPPFPFCLTASSVLARAASVCLHRACINVYVHACTVFTHCTVCLYQCMQRYIRVWLTGWSQLIKDASGSVWTSADPTLRSQNKIPKIFCESLQKQCCHDTVCPPESTD